MFSLPSPLPIPPHKQSILVWGCSRPGIPVLRPAMAGPITGWPGRRWCGLPLEPAESVASLVASESLSVQNLASIHDLYKREATGEYSFGFVFFLFFSCPGMSTHSYATRLALRCTGPGSGTLAQWLPDAGLRCWWPTVGPPSQALGSSSSRATGSAFLVTETMTRPGPGGGHLPCAGRSESPPLPGPAGGHTPLTVHPL